MEYRFEKLEAHHGQAVAEILNYYIKNSTAVYREDLVTKEIIGEFLEENPGVHCSYAVVGTDGTAAGFCLLEPHMPISTFGELAEVMYFLHPDHTGKGLGGRILAKLEDDAKKRGIRKLLADASSENEGSIRFHERHGFVRYGLLSGAGKKLGRSFGIVYLAKELD